jgi:DNA polymerase I-like protein with 3'-5' exonuclease and polymerase domains
MWWMSKAMIRCQEYLDKYNATQRPHNHIYMIAQIHDELLFDFPKVEQKQFAVDSNRAIVLKLKQLMEQGGDDIGIPTPVNVEYHSVCWAEGEAI